MIIIPKRGWRYPIAYEKSYNKTLRAYVARIIEECNMAIPEIKAVLEAAGARFDDYDSDLTALLDRIGARIDRRVAETAIRRRIEQIYGQVNRFNDEDFRAIVGQAVGAKDFYINENWQSVARSVFVQENLDLIRSIKSQTLEKLRYKMGDMVMQAQDNALQASELSGMIQDIAHNERNRADLIARDQIGKLNGRMTQFRQQSAGITRYIWRTSRDERVRPSHQERDGKEFEWAKPPSDGNPGIPIRCRCIAIPVIDTETLGAPTPVSVEPTERIAGVKAGKPMTWEEADSGHVNPHVHESGEYRINCQSSVVTMEARLRGFNMEVLPNTPGSKLEELSKRTNLAWIDPETGEHPEYLLKWNYVDKMEVKVNTPRRLIKWMKENLQDQARYTIEFGWKSYNSGHIVCIGKDELGNLRMYDPQMDKTYYENDILKYFSRVRFQVSTPWGNYYVGPKLLRVDTMQFDYAMVDYIMKEAGT